MGTKKAHFALHFFFPLYAFTLCLLPAGCLRTEGQDKPELPPSEPLPPPEITSIEPSVGPRRGGNVVTFSGGFFLPDMAVSFGSAAAVSVTVLSTEQAEVVPPEANETGFVDITARTEGGETRIPNAYRYVVPEIQDIVPGEGPLEGGAEVRIHGQWFTTAEDTLVSFGAEQASVLEVAPTEIAVLSPAGSSAGPVDVTVSNFYGVAVREGGFVYRPVEGAPTVQSVVPESGPPGGGTLVRIQGSGFSAPGLRVTICGRELEDIQVLSDVLLEGRTPPGPPDQACDVIVETESGSATAQGAFSYTCDLGKLTVLFPLGGITTAEEIPFTGCFEAPPGATLLINGTAVALGPDGRCFEHTVPLQVGVNTVELVLQSGTECDGQPIAAVTIVREELGPLGEPIGLAVDQQGNIFYSDYLLRSVVLLNGETAARQTVKSPVPAFDIDFAPPDLLYLSGLSVLWSMPAAGGPLSVNGVVPYPVPLRSLVQESETTVLCLAPSQGALWRIQTEERQEQLVAARDGDAPFVLSSPTGLALLPDGRVALSDTTEGRVVAIDPATGERTFLSGPEKGTGPELRAPGPLATLSSDALLVTSSDPDILLYGVSIATGDRWIVSSSSHGSGPLPDRTADFARFAGGDIEINARGKAIVACPTTAMLLEVDPESGDRSLLASGGFGPGPILGTPGAAAAAERHLFIVERNRGLLFKVDYESAERTVHSALEGVRGPFTGAAIAEEILYVTAPEESLILQLDLASGGQSIFSGGQRGSGPPLSEPYAVAWRDPDTVLVADRGSSAIFEIERATGNRRIISGADVGSGPELEGLSAITQAGQYIVAATRDGQIFRIEETGERLLFTSLPPEAGELFAAAAQSDGTMLLLSEGGLYELSRRNEIHVLSGPEQEPRLIRGAGLACDPHGRLFVIDSAWHAVFQVDPKSGERIIFSR